MGKLFALSFFPLISLFLALEMSCVCSSVFFFPFSRFSIRLEDHQGKLVDNHEVFKVCLEAFTCELPRNKIEISTEGEPIFRGKTKTKIKNGKGFFDKIRFQDLTCRYRNNWVYFVVFAEERNDVKPLVLDKVMVKAKKPKEMVEQENRLKKALKMKMVEEKN